MVVQGKFSVRLINASTMKPLQEHSTATGKTYVTLAPNVDFMVQPEPLQPQDDERSSFSYHISVGNASRRNFKRRQSLEKQQLQSSCIFRFRPTATQSYESLVMEEITVRIFQVVGNGKGSKRHLETITLHCCVLPPVKPPFWNDRATSLGSLLTAAAFPRHNQPPSPQPGGCCWIKKQGATLPTTAAAAGLVRSRMTPHQNKAPSSLWPLVSS